MKYKEWTRIPWDGNLALGYECWRKSFGRGHVSVGIGSFLLICYSYGANSYDSMSSTRWRKAGPPETENAAMLRIDREGGHYKSHN